MKTLALPALVFSALAGLPACNNPSPVGAKIPMNDSLAWQHIIPATVGKQYIGSFKEGLAVLEHNREDSAYIAQHFQLPVAEAFNRDAIIALLNADSAAGIRIYLGRDSAGEVRLVLLPMNKNGQDIITKLVPGPPVKGVQARSATVTGEEQAVETGQRCPTMCDSLNSF